MFLHISVGCSFLLLSDTPFNEYTMYVYPYPVDRNLCHFQFRVVKSFFVDIPSFPSGKYLGGNCWIIG